MGQGTIYQDESLSSEWTANVWKNIEDTTSTYEGVEGYVVPCDVINSGQTIRVYGIHTEVDPRSGEPNDKVLVIGLVGVINPSYAITATRNTWDVVHKRWSYPGGPVFKIHETEDIAIDDNMLYEDIKVTCAYTNV